MPASRNPSGPLALVLVAGILLVSSAITVYAEFVPLSQVGTTLQEKVSALSTGAIVPGPSYRSKFRVLSDCNQALNSFEGNLLPTDQRHGLLDNCQHIARAVLVDEPSYSLAWYIDALAAEGLVDSATLSASLAQSQQTAPHQEWLARSRAILAERHLETLTPSAVSAYHQDLALLVQSSLGSAWVAQRYVSDPSFRDLITTIVEQLPAEAQRQFLGAVRAAS